MEPLRRGESRFQAPSFRQPVTPPTAEVCDAPTVCLSFNVQYLPIVLGALLQGLQPSTWLVDNDTDREIALRRWSDLLGEVGSAVPCNPAPYQPPGVDTAQQACNIAGYLANVVIRQAMDKALSAAQQDLLILNFGLVIIRLIPGVGFVYPAFAAAVTGFLQNIISGQGSITATRSATMSSGPR